MPMTPSLLNKMPDLIVLDTRQLVKYLRAKITALTNVDISEEVLLSTVFESLQMDGANVGLEIDISCEIVTREHLGFTRCTEACGLQYCDNGCVSEDEAVETAKSLSEFAHQIHRELKRINAYTGGYLFYQFKQLLGSDVVLIKLDIPEG